MITIKVRNGKVEEAISVFSDKVKRSGLLMEFKDRQEFKKPSEVKREQRKKAIRNARIAAK